MDQLIEAVRAGIQRSPHPDEVRGFLEGEPWEQRDAKEHIALCIECTDWLTARGILARLEEIRELFSPPVVYTPMPEHGPCCRDWPHLYG